MNWISAMRRFFNPELAIGLLLVSLVVILFLPSRSYEFTPLDDRPYTYGNPHIKQGLTSENIRWALTSTEEKYWIPATRLSYLIDVDLFGIVPSGFRCTNILLHTLNTLLLFILLRKTTHALWPAAMTAALFAVHPLRVESVVWITERKDVLCTAWSLLSILFYVNWQAKEKKRPLAYLLSLLCFFIGLCAKPLWIMLPALLLLLDLWPLKRVHITWDKRAFENLGVRCLEKIPYGLFSLLFAGITVYTQNKAIIHTSQSNLPGRIPLMSFNYAFYIEKFFWPVDLVLEYAKQDFLSPAEWIPAALALAALTLLALLFIKKAPYLATGWFWYLIALFPVSGFIRVGTVTRADRFSYLPSIGLLLILVWTAYEGIQRLPRQGRRAVLIVLLLLPVLLAVQTRKQMAWWKTGQSILEHTIQITGGSAVVHNNMGALLTEAGRHTAAIQYFEKALQMDPEYDDAHYNKNRTTLLHKNYKAAIAYYEEALINQPDQAGAYNNLAWVLATCPDSTFRNGARAVELAQQAVKLGGEIPALLDTLAAALAENGQYSQAVSAAGRALEMARNQNDASAVEKFRSRLTLYQSGVPFHESND